MVKAYAIIPILSGLLMAYVFSLSAKYLGIISQSTHRRFWNIMLLGSFLVTASLGLILAIQVNYKFKLSILDPLMKIHVDFGVSLAIISIFHLTWHLKYYLHMFRRAAGAKAASHTTPPGETAQGIMALPAGLNRMIPVLVLGFTTMITQIVFIREFLHVFHGNELIIGVVLANWLFLTASGALLGKFSPQIQHDRRFTPIALGVIGGLPILMIFVLYLLKNQIFIPGSLTGLFDVFLSSFILLSPFCLLSGYTFVFFTHIISKQDRQNQISRVYGFESLGALLGGASFSIILIHFLNVFQILALIFAISILAIYFTGNLQKSRYRAWILAIPASLILILSMVLPLDHFAQQFLYRNQVILETQETPFGHLVLTRMGDQVNIYENQMLLASSLNVIANEEDVHYTMLQHPDPKDILLISGGITGMIDEILKYPVSHIDVVELNPAIAHISESLTDAYQSEKVHLINQDARKYIEQTNRHYQVVLLHMPPPSTAQINRYYTSEFYLNIKKILTENGVFGFGLPYSRNYPGRLTNDLLSQVYSTVQPIFKNIVIIPGEKIYFICDPSGQADLNITERLENKGISNEYVASYYLDDELIKDRASSLFSTLRNDLDPNTDFHPRAFFWEIRLWLSYFKWDTRILIMILVLIAALLLVNMRCITAAMFTAGFAGAGMEFIIIFMFQVLYGYLYLMIGIVITAIMAGIAIGALIPRGMFARIHSRNFINLLGFVALASILTPVLFYGFIRIPGIPDWLGQFLLVSWSLCFSFLIGRVFYQASRIQTGLEAQVSARIYSMDLFGAAFGALLVSSVLLPLIGIWQTSMVIGFINLLSAFFFWMKRPGQIAFSD